MFKNIVNYYYKNIYVHKDINLHTEIYFLDFFREIFSEYSYIKPNLDCKYAFLIHLTPNEIPFGVKSGKCN